MKAMKFRVHSPQHSEAIQRKLFDLGYKWPVLENFVQLTNEPYLCVGELKTLAYTKDIKVFLNNEGTETTLDDLYREEQSQTLADKLEKLEQITKEMFEAIDNLKEGK